MRFRLHTASSGQVKRNETAIAALSAQIDALQADVDAISPSEGGIEITGADGAFVFRHALYVSTSNYTTDTTYNITLDQGVYTTDELVAALNAAIEAQGSVVDLSGHFTGLPEAFTITTSIAYIDGRFLIRCSSTIAHPYGIEILSDATADASGTIFEILGFVQSQSAGVFGAFTADDIFGTDLDLVATNAPITTGSGNNNATIDALLLRVDELESAGLGGTPLVTTQVTGEFPVSTSGTIIIDDAELTAVTFADAFSNGISHALDASIFNVTAAGDYTINVQLQVTDDSTTTGRAVYWVSCRRYQNRTTAEAIGTAYRDYYLGNCYYRDRGGAVYAGRITLGGNVRVHLESTTEQFQIIIQMLYQGANGILEAGEITIDNSASWITIERHDTAIITETVNVNTIEIIPTVNDVFAFRHVITGSSASDASTTYTINLDHGVFTTDEMVTALNAAIETQGSVAHGLTTSIAYIDGHFLIRITTPDGGLYPLSGYSIEILSDATAAASLGFVQNQTANVFGADESDGNLDLVAANTPP